MKRFLILITTLSCLAIENVAFSQHDSIQNNISVVLTQHIFRGTRLQYERRINSQLWLQVAPMHHYSEKPFGEAEAFWGIGGALGAKLFLNNKHQARGLFLLGSLDYNYFDLSHYGSYLEPTQWNGFAAYVPAEGFLHQKVNRWKGMLSLGVQNVMWNVTLGGRMGVGYQHSFIDVEHNDTPIMTDTIFGFAYSGYTYNISVYIGVIF